MRWSQRFLPLRSDEQVPDESVTNRISEAQQFLKELGFDAERTNQRSARVLLALLKLEPGVPWSEATNDLVGTTEIMNWIRDHLNLTYAPNTRETIRRQTLHQFASALLVEQNPDNPKRPVNSPKWCYRVHPRALELAQLFGSTDLETSLRQYLNDKPGLVTQYAAEREMNRIPVTLPDGTELTLSPGGQNVLIREMAEQFCSRFTPGGQVVYVGDADEKWAVFEKSTLHSLGVQVDSHGKMPDLVIYMPDKNWLVLMEAASTHGPVDAKRHAELKNLFSGSTAGPVYVSCFPSRAEMRKYLAVIAWETEVWCADNPSHLIHFNGERFLGPYS